jgi:hypothetical protein
VSTSSSYLVTTIKQYVKYTVCVSTLLQSQDMHHNKSCIMFNYHVITEFQDCTLRDEPRERSRYDWLQAGRQRFWSFSPCRDSNCRTFSSCRPDRFWGPSSLLSNVCRIIFPWEVKRSNREADNHVQLVPWSIERDLYILCPHIPTWHSV